MEEIVRKLIKLSNKALINNDVPISCIIVKNGVIIAKEYNKKVKNNDPTAHAEILCIKKTAKLLKTNNLNDCELYCLLSPCNMCREVIKEVRIKNVYSALNNSDPNNLNIITKIFEKDSTNPKVNFESNLSPEKAKEILSSFFEKQRNI